MDKMRMDCLLGVDALEKFKVKLDMEDKIIKINDEEYSWKENDEDYNVFDVFGHPTVILKINLATFKNQI
ncbi:hypothetical protein RN001_002878 [Aquatica leii]|uniref:Uncharacterized protein n=1 Tax=Aquatica leii TaxID=1421715 RepID=A0AAN7SKE7_9COLE|nr:hypothetical protein RN001_002878 [Aquatica leii]